MGFTGYVYLMLYNDGEISGKEKVYMKPSKCLAPMLLLFLAIAGIGCAHSEKSSAEKSVRSELDLLKNLDSSTVQKYISYTDLFPMDGSFPELTEEIEDIFTLFFQNFDYRIEEIDVDRMSGKGTAQVLLRTLDARTLARDFEKARLRQEILSTAVQSGSESFSLTDRYVLLYQQLKAQTYDITDSVCTIHLEKAGNKWSVIRTSSLENALVGGLIAYLSDPNLLSPDETLTVCFNTLKEMNTEELAAYLGVAGLLSGESGDSADLAAALAQQVLTCFDFEIQESQVNGYLAWADVDITSFDSSAILERVEKETRDYLGSPQAVVDGSEIRHAHCHEILISCISENEVTIKTSSRFHMVNNGAGWSLQDDNSELGQALFGSFPQDGTELSDTVLAEMEEEGNEPDNPE